MRTNLALLAVLAAVLMILALCAVFTHTYAVDEAGWFMRSQESPLSFSDPRAYAWAVDVPALNRWVYWAVLDATGLDRVPDGERRIWNLRSDAAGRPELYAFDIRWPGQPGAAEARKPSFLSRREREWGAVAPRRAIVVMRLVNVLTFGAVLLCLWLVGALITRPARHWKWLAAIMPGAVLCSVAYVLPATAVAWRIWSGDVFLTAFLTGGLALWLWLHKRGTAATGRGALALGVVAGLAVSAKLTGLLMLWPMMLYLGLTARGVRRLTLPAICAGAAFAVFLAVNPALYLTGRAPWTVCADMLARRGQVVDAWLRNRPVLSFFGAVAAVTGTEGRVLLPILAYVLWRKRRAWYVLPILSWALFLVVGTIGGAVSMGMFHAHYAAPYDLGFGVLVVTAFLAMLTDEQRRESRGTVDRTAERGKAGCGDTRPTGR
jgi:hypothetical protein